MKPPPSNQSLLIIRSSLMFFWGCLIITSAPTEKTVNWVSGDGATIEASEVLWSEKRTWLQNWKECNAMRPSKDVCLYRNPWGNSPPNCFLFFLMREFLPYWGSPNRSFTYGFLKLNSWVSTGGFVAQIRPDESRGLCPNHPTKGR